MLQLQSIGGYFNRIVSRNMDIVDICLRLPLIFIMDGILSYYLVRMFLVEFSPDPKLVAMRYVEEVNRIDEGIINYLIYSLNINFFSKVAAIVLVFMFAMVASVLMTNYLVDTYCFLSTVLFILASFWWNNQLANAVVESLKVGSTLQSFVAKIPDPISHSGLFTNFLVQSFCSLIIIRCLLDGKWRATQNMNYYCRLVLKVGVILSCQLPLLFVCLDQPITVIGRSPVLSVFFSVGLLNYAVIQNSEDLGRFFVHGVRETIRFIQTHGLLHFLEHHWTRLQIPRLLGTFWIIKISTLFLGSLARMALHEAGEPPRTFQDVMFEFFNASQEIVLVSGSDNFVSLCGMTSVVSLCCRWIVFLMAVIVGVPEDDDWRYGQVSAILFLLLALQTGIMGLSPSRRVERMYRNLCLLNMAMLHFVHSMCKQVLLHLSAGHQTNWRRHVRALAVCFFLLAFPTLFLIVLWRTFSVCAWMLAVTAFGSEVMVKVLFTLLQYALFMIDSKSEQVWVELDDYIYYIKAAGKCIEFFFGIFLFFNGAWIFLYESGGAIRAVMLCIHIYFNIWVQAKEGWRTFSNRLNAAHKIGSLPDSSANQLASLNDVCAICYSDNAAAAKITPCGHIFHTVCLRKWLYVQDTCPLCHSTVYSSNESTTPQLQIPPPAPAVLEQQLPGANAWIDGGYNVLDDGHAHVD